MNDDVIDTVEAGAGSYPNPPESKLKDYQFEFIGTVKGYGYVTAKNIEEAEDLIKKGRYDDIVETYDLKIEDITKLEEE